MLTRTSRRLPGFQFEVQPPPLTEVLPRMDLAVFVGFASAGPLHTPVVVEDVAHFVALFGDDLPLAWDQQRGEMVSAYLAPAVRAFFRNGGRRCWVVRVAGDAVSNYFPIPGLVEVRTDDDGLVQGLAPAFAQARSEGSWSDGLLVGSALLNDLLPVELLALEKGSIALTLASSSAPGIGDLVRLTFPAEELVAFFPVRVLTPLPAESTGSPPDGSPLEDVLPGRPAGLVRAAGSLVLWFSSGLPSSPPPVGLHARQFTSAGPAASINVLWSEFLSPQGGQGTQATLKLDLAHANAPDPGALLHVDCDMGQFWMAVQEVHLLSDAGSPPTAPPMETVEVSGQGLWPRALADPVISSIQSAPGRFVAERLTFELWARQGSAPPVHVSDLGFAAGHARFWGALPTDQELYQPDASPSPHPYAALRATVADPRFPLAHPADVSALAIPIAMPVLPKQWPSSERAAGTELERNGLATFSAALFLDPQLLEAHVEDFMAQADFLRYEGLDEHLVSRQLRGIHAALGLEEATIIAVPDAVHRGWAKAGQFDPPPAQVSAPLPHPEWWRFLPCDPPSTPPPAAAPQWGNFLDCGLRVLESPHLDKSGDHDHAGTFTLFWTTLAEPGARYLLEEANSADFAGAVTISTGSNDRVTLYGRSPGDYYYRVRAVVGALSSNWSNGVAVRVAGGGLWQVRAESDYSADVLLAVQRALLRMCAARGDLFAVLSLPGHFREDDALKHVATLKSPAGRPGLIDLGDGHRAALPALGYEEARVFSYGALYHPWLIGSEESQPALLRSMPPDGAACGVLAERALTRGAWIAPANELLQGVVALMPPVSRDRWLDLQTAQINVLRQEPRGFLALSADTLSDDPDLRPINVRRLLILLRRMALRLGATYVFEPNSPAFQRLVQRGFEAMLGEMYVRGAFAGDSPATSFQVVTNDSLNTPQSVEQGRFIVELRVAPSLPMTFLTLRLVQSSDQASVTEVL